MILWSLLFGGKHEDKRVKNLFPTLVATFLLKGGLNQVMFLFLIFFLGSLWRGSFGSWFVLSVVFFLFFFGGGSKFQFFPVSVVF